MKHISSTGTYFASHYPGDGGFGDHEIRPRGESEAHKYQKEYYARAAERSGYRVAMEVATGKNTILDVAIYGRQNIGLEMQISRITGPKVLDRFCKSLSAGFPSVWYAGARNPKWLHRVPSMTGNDLPWDFLPKPGSVYVNSLRKMVMKRCNTMEQGLNRCPLTNRPPCCGGEHPDLVPLIIDEDTRMGKTADEVVEMLPENGLVSVHNVLKSGNLVYLVYPADAALYRELTKDVVRRLTDSEVRIQIGRSPRTGDTIHCHYDASSQRVMEVVRPFEQFEEYANQVSLFDEYGLREECHICGVLLPGHEDWCGTARSFTDWH